MGFDHSYAGADIYLQGAPLGLASKLLPLQNPLVEQVSGHPLHEGEVDMGVDLRLELYRLNHPYRVIYGSSYFSHCISVIFNVCLCVLVRLGQEKSFVGRLSPGIDEALLSEKEILGCDTAAGDKYGLGGGSLDGADAMRRRLADESNPRGSRTYRCGCNHVPGLMKTDQLGSKHANVMRQPHCGIAEQKRVRPSWPAAQ